MCWRNTQCAPTSYPFDLQLPGKMNETSSYFAGKEPIRTLWESADQDTAANMLGQIRLDRKSVETITRQSK